jgi:tetratricopeptide (TPR) repeat protein
LELSKFVEADPSDLDASRALSHHYVILGRALEARPLAERCVQERPDWLGAWETLVSSHIELGDYPAAQRALERVPEPGQGTSWYWHYQGILAEQNSQWDAAEAALRQAVAYDPYDRRLHYRLGIILQRRGENLDQARNHLDRSSELATIRQRLREIYRHVILINQQNRPIGANLCFAMGNDYELLGRSDAAIAWYREAIKRNAQDSRSREGLSRLLSRNSGFGSDRSSSEPLP